MSKHTKGPWRVAKRIFPAIEGDFGEVVSLVTEDQIIDIWSIGARNTEKQYKKYIEKVNMAQLIAAAPELLSAIERVFEMSNDSNSNPHELLAKISQIAEQAINKAEEKK